MLNLHAVLPGRRANGPGVHTACGSRVAPTDGRFVAARRVARGLRGSSNQVIHLLTDRYRSEDLERTPVAEVAVDTAGNGAVSGVRPLRIGGDT